MTMMPVLNSGYAAPLPLQREALDTTVVVVLLDQLEPELIVPALPGESADELAARRAAAADITDEILAEIGSAA